MNLFDNTVVLERQLLLQLGDRLKRLRKAQGLGIYLSIPFDAMFTRDLGGKANIVWTPLTRDGGQKLNRQFALYDMTALRDARALEFAPPPLPG